MRDAVAGYGGSLVVNGISLEVGESEFVAMLGPNGHGKTTLLRAISGLVPLTGGAVVLDGERLDRLAPDAVVRRGVVHIPQGDLPFPQMTVAENLLMGGYLVRDRRERFERLDHVLSLFPNLQERRHLAAQALSGGERRMLALGRGLMGRPRVILIDEPSLGLAPKIVAEIYERIEAIHRSGVAVLLVDETAEHAARLAERMYVVESGAVVRAGETQEIVGDARLMAAYLG